MEREVINTDGKIYLASMVTEDKAPYFKLCKEIFGNDELYDRVMDTERIWASIVSGEKIVYSILDEQMNFSGDIELQNYDTRIPGIGIEIIGDKRNWGIGTAALKLFFQSTYNKKTIDYYSILIRKNNMCSRPVLKF